MVANSRLDWSIGIEGKVRMTVKRGFTRFAFILVAGTMLSGCAIFDGDVFNESFWSSSPFKQNENAELGIAELAKGNYVTADNYFQKALSANPRDVHALLGAGILYQNTGQFVRAREMYEAVLAIRPEDSQQFVTWSQIATRPASQVASVNLSLLENGGGTPAAVSTVGAAPVGGAPTGDVLLGRVSPEVASAPAALPARQSGLPSLSTPVVAGQFTGGYVNVVSRFATLKALRDQGLVTEQEYQQRRSSNVGALLPLTSPPPAAGLDRPVPSTEQISARIQSIGRSLEMRAISVSQHAAERSVILDGLLSAAPVVVASPAPPPTDLLEAADSVRRLELLRDGGYITTDEYARERQAVELAVAPKPTSVPAAAQTTTPAAPQQMAKKEPAMASGPQPAVHLASYRSAKQAEDGWKKIMRAHGNLLGQLQYEVSRVRLGSKGTYFRLKAGPLQSVTEAKSLCGQLKRRRQFCDTTVMNDG